MEHLNVTTLLPVWEWSSQPSGSGYVNRQSIYYFSEEFIPLCKTPIFLANVPKKFLMTVVMGDFLQVRDIQKLTCESLWREFVKMLRMMCMSWYRLR